MDACLPTHRLRSDFLGVPGGPIFVVPVIVPVSVPVRPQTHHSQCNVVQTSRSSTPLMDRRLHNTHRCFNWFTVERTAPLATEFCYCSLNSILFLLVIGSYCHHFPP